MRYAVKAEEMKQIDLYSIEQIGLPSVVLMERAALTVAFNIENIATKEGKILVVCGTGNNGGDGIAIARILHQKGYKVDFIILGDMDKLTEESKLQLFIAKNLGMCICSKFLPNEYNIIVDAIFGIGLKKDIEGEYQKVIESMNDSDAYIVSVDVPSGVDATTGKIKNIAVEADLTVTFGENKLGLILFPGSSYAGKVVVEDIGFPKEAFDAISPKYHYFEKDDLKRIPKRYSYSNKGSYGKVLIIAGSTNMTGAAYLSAKAAYHMGCGLVKVLTSNEGVKVIRTLLPEAIYASYEVDNLETVMSDAIRWADAIVIGPGLSTDKKSKQLLNLLWKEEPKPTVYDADALQILSNDLNDKNSDGITSRIRELSFVLPENSVLTPHLKELANLLSCTVEDIIKGFIDFPEYCTYNNKLIYVIKDARTIVAHREKRYINVSGNHGMATGGSGDVLTGIIAGLIASGLKNYEAAELGVYIHGLAGDVAAEKKGYHSMLASDILEALPEVIRENERRSI